MGKRPTKPRRKLRNYIIDKRLQLRYVVAVSLISALLAGGLGYLLWQQETKASTAIIRSLNSEDADFLGLEGKAQLTQALTGDDTRLILLVGGVGIGLIAILTLYLIVMTHKVAGPLYKVGTYLDEISDGKLPEAYPLRKGDQLQDFYAKFRAMLVALRERTAEETRIYQGVIDACGEAAGGELGHAIDELKSLKKKREAALS